MRRASSRRGGVPARLAAWAASAAALLLIVLLGLGHVQRAGANVMGIDLGSEFMKVRASVHGMGIASVCVWAV